ncbi:MAG TPA: DUF2911 domain-containing protein [Chitinophagaceae bacterium]
MKSILFFATLFFALTVCGQDKSTRPSPPDSVSVTLNSGTTVSISYSQPAVKGRTIGKDLEPLPGKVWRTGANEATVFGIDKNVTIEGTDLPAGKYALFTIANGDDWTIIFNKTWNQWGAFDYKQADDALRVNVKAGKASEFAERMKFQISKDGIVTLLWGNIKVNFKVS